MKLELQQEWILGEPIGDPGGFGAVYEARSAAGEQVAVKLVPKQPGAEREMLFTDLDGVHNVVPIIDSGEHEDQWVLVMPRAEKSLRQHLQQHGRLPLNEAVAVLTDVTETLADLDGTVVHRDLKPENILLLGGHWCLADFGIARYAEATTANHTFKLAGTSAYMAPERWKGDRATSASDIYALGIVAYELIAGTKPFTGPNGNDFYEQHLHGTPLPLSTAPALLAALITECLYKAPEARPAAGNVLARLHSIPVAALSGGLAALAEANQGAVVRRAEAGRQASEQATEAERRGALFEAAKTSFGFIASAFLAALQNAAPSAEVRKGKLGGWTIRINDAQLTLSGPQEVALGVWRNNPAPPPFDVIASATVSLRVPVTHHGYDGRSHSLWYADAQTEAQYQWFETAFMNGLVRSELGTTEPFALNPHHESRAAVDLSIGMHQVAWPFTPLVIGDLDEYVGRWADWLAQAANGRLAHPSHMPERDPQGSWRR